MFRNLLTIWIFLVMAFPCRVCATGIDICSNSGPVAVCGGGLIIIRPGVLVMGAPSAPLGVVDGSGCYTVQNFGTVQVQTPGTGPAIRIHCGTGDVLNTGCLRSGSGAGLELDAGGSLNNQGGILSLTGTGASITGNFGGTTVFGNSGSIFGGLAGTSVDVSDTIVFSNSGSIQSSTGSGLSLVTRTVTPSPAESFTNRGDIFGANGATVTFAGATIVDPGPSTLTFNNCGRIQGTNGFGLIYTSNVTGDSATNAFTNGGLIAATGNNGVFLINTGTNGTLTINNSGVIQSSLGQNGLGFLGALTVGTFTNSGSISGTSNTIFLTGQEDIFFNNGGVIRDTTGGETLTINSSAGTISFANSGSISGAGIDTIALTTAQGSVTFANSGAILGNLQTISILATSGDVNFTNSGILSGGTGAEIINVSSGAGTVSFLNSGTLSGTSTCIGLSTASGTLLFVNGGLLTGGTAPVTITGTNPGGPASFQNSGQIISGSTTISFRSAGATSFTNQGLIQLASGSATIVLAGGTLGGAQFNNAGTIGGIGGATLFLAGSDVSLTNSGLFISQTTPGLTVNVTVDQTFCLNNTGRIVGIGGATLNITATTANLVNSGTISGGPGLGITYGTSGANTFVNNGRIAGATGGVSATTQTVFSNSGCISSTFAGSSAVALAAGGTVTNSGTLFGAAGAFALSGSCGLTVVNTGTLAVASGTAVQFNGAATNTLTLATGSDVRGDITGGTGTDNLILSGRGAYAGNVSNFETLVKQGAGVWTLGGSTNIATTSVINGGTLSINGTLTTPILSVTSAGALSGNGTVIGNVTNDGVVSGGQATGTLSITGNYTQNAGGSLVTALQTSGFNRLTVTGVASLSGSLQFGFAGVLTNGLSFNVLHSDQPLVGGFTTIQGPPPSAVLSLNVVQSTNDVTINATRRTYASLAATDNQVNVGQVLDIAVQQAVNQNINDPNSFANLVLSLDRLSTVADVDRALDQLTPEVYNMHLELMLINAQASMYQLDHYFDMIRMNLDNPFTRPATSPAVGLVGRSPAGSAIRQAPVTPVPLKGLSRSHDQDTNMGAFGFYYGFKANESTDLAPGGVVRTGFDLKSQGGLGGVDMRVAEGLTVGLAFGGGQTNGALDLDRGSVQAHIFQVGPYLTYNEDHWYVDGSIMLSSFNFDTQRVVAFPGLRELEVAHHKGDTFSVYGATGYLWRSGGFTYGPTASLQYTSVTLDAFNEGGGLAVLGVDESETDSVLGTAGVRIVQELELENGSVLIPEARVRWAHEFSQDARSLSARFLAGPTNPFVTTLAAVDSNRALVGTSLTALINEDLLAYGTYDGDLGRNGGNIHAWHAGLTYKF